MSKSKLKVGDEVEVTVCTYGDSHTPVGRRGVIASRYNAHTWEVSFSAEENWYFQDDGADGEFVKVEKTKKTPKGPQAYKGNGKHEWEVSCSAGRDFSTWRLRVPGGWLYRVGTSATATTFVPVPAAVGYSV